MNSPRAAMFRQLPLGRALSVSLSVIAHKIFDPHCGTSYAQSGEDRQILSYLSNSPNTFYVDIGCHFPDDKSNTYLLYQMGWHGLCVDANDSLTKRFKKVRPKDLVECVCVGEASGEVKFVISDDPALSHLDGEQEVHWLANKGARQVTVPMKTLQQLFEEHNVPGQIGLLSIDVEGLDFRVLKSFDMRRWRPHLIVCEAHGLDLHECDKSEIVIFLRQAGYRFVGYNSANAFFLDTANTNGRS